MFSSAAQLGFQLGLKNLLVPVDFSPRSESAVRLARAIARRHDSTIHLVNVIDSFDVSGMSTDRRSADAERARADFHALEIKYLGGVDSREIVLDGDVNLSLTRAIKSRNIDLVVMATHGAAGFERLFAGSVTEELFREADCPVLTVGPNVNEDFERFASSGRVLYPMEITPSSIAAVPFVVALADCGSRIILLHVLHPDIQSPSERQRLRDRLSVEMRMLFPERARPSLANVIVEFGPVAETIVEFAVARHVDVVVLGVRGAGAFSRSATHVPWSIAQHIIREAPCPVLTVRKRPNGKDQ